MVGNGRHCSHIIKVHKSLANISNTLIETFYFFLLGSPRSQPTQFLGWFLTFWGTAACHPARPCGNRRGCGTPDPADLWQVLNQSYSQQPRWACRGWGESREESCTTGAPSKVTEPFQCCLWPAGDTRWRPACPCALWWECDRARAGIHAGAARGSGSRLCRPTLCCVTIQANLAAAGNLY